MKRNDHENGELDDSFEHRRDALNRTDRQLLKADLRDEARSHCRHSLETDGDNDASPMADGEEVSYERRIAINQQDASDHG